MINLDVNKANIVLRIFRIFAIFNKYYLKIQFKTLILKIFYKKSIALEKR